MENSIEENIKEIECFFKRNYFVNYDWTIIHRNSMANLEDSIEDILSDYKRVLKENNRLEEQVEYDKTHIYTPQTIELNFISKSKVEDKIEEIAKKIKREENEKVVLYLHKQRKVLQELLEKEK